MIAIFKKFHALLDRRERRNLYLFFVGVVIMACLEVVSVASILPFLSVAADPGMIQQNGYLLWAYEAFGFADTNAFLIALGLAAIVATGRPTTMRASDEMAAQAGELAWEDEKGHDTETGQCVAEVDLRYHSLTELDLFPGEAEKVRHQLG